LSPLDPVTLVSTRVDRAVAQADADPDHLTFRKILVADAVSSLRRAEGVATEALPWWIRCDGPLNARAQAVLCPIVDEEVVAVGLELRPRLASARLNIEISVHLRIVRQDRL